MAARLVARLALKDAETVGVVEECLKESGGFLTPKDPRDPCDVLVLEIEADDPDPAAALRHARDAAPQAALLVVSRLKDASFLIEAMRLGLRDFFTIPLDRGAFLTALSRLKDSVPAEAPARGKRGRIIGVMGAKGGAGTTTVAVNIAAAVQEALGERSVVLLDMNMPYGEVQMFLDIRPKYDMGEVIRNVSRLDALYLMDVLSRHDSGLHVLPCPSMREDLQMISPETMGGVLNMLSDLFNVIVVDMGIYLDEVTLKVIEMAEEVALVAEPSLTCVTSLKRMVEHVRGAFQDQAAKLRLVMNRAHADADLNKDDVAEVAGLPVFAELPLDYKSAVQAINAGRTVLELFPKTPLAKSVRSLAENLLPDAAPKPKKHGLLGLDGLFGHKRA